MKITKNINIYLIQKRNVRVIDVVQYDTGIQLAFTVKDFSIPSGASATLYAQKPSGKFVYQEDGIAVVGNTITIDLENQAITEHGKVPYQVSITSGSDVITTFTGLMLVGKSLKDAGAVESKTVIRAFDDAVADHVAEFQAKAEQIAAACVATIPDDYTTMEAKVNELANAVKGNLSGAVVAADDVSTVEHNPVVKVHGKNLVDTSKIPVQDNTDNIYISAVGEGYIDITTKEAYDGNGHCVTLVKLKELCPQMQAGKQYALSATTTAWNKMIYLKEIDMFWAYGTRRVVTEEMLECTIGFYGLNSIREQGFGTCRISDIQCELGYNITEYTPYMDPSTVTVSRFGKNLIPPYDRYTQGGYTVAKNSNGSVTVTGKSTTDSAIYLNLSPVSANPFVLHKGTKYCFTWHSDNGRNGYIKLLDINGENKWITAPIGSTILNGDEYAQIVQICTQIGASATTDPNAVGDTSLCGTYRFQLEVGEAETSFEAYREPTEHIPSSDGNVSGIVLSQSMTIITDTEGIIVECEYNRDTNKVIGKIINGTVISENADFAEVGEWADGNPDGEDRTGYFVSVDTSEPGKTMVKSTSASDVRGITMLCPAFAGNASADKYDSYGNLLPQYAYVGFAGFVSVIDNGTCAVNGRCMPADDGTAIPSTNNMGYQVIERIDNTHVLILVEPQADMMVRIKDDISAVKSDLKQLAETGVPASNIAQAVSDYLTENPVEVAIDSTLTNSGQAADAKAVGDAINSLSTEIAGIDLTNYYKKPEVDALIPNVSGYATETYVDNAIANIPTGGGETWRLVQDITLETEDVGTIEFTTDSDGKALNLKKFALICKVKASAAASSYITLNGKAFLSTASPYQSYNFRPFQLQGDFCKGFLTLQLVAAVNNAVNGVSMYTHIYSGNFNDSALEKIEGSGLTLLRISPQTSTVTLLTGSHVELWGVDA